jgi:hypothetical protein
VSLDDAEIQAERELSTMALDAYRYEYADSLSLWEGLERKAQGTTAIAGIMLAAGFAFARQLDANVGALPRLLLIGVVLTLLFSIWQSVRALTITRVEPRPSADAISQQVIDALQSPDRNALPDLVNGVRHEQLEHWRSSNAVLAAACGQKASLVQKSQSAILISALLIGIVTGSQVIFAKAEVAQGVAGDAKVHDSGVYERRETTGREMRGAREERQWPGAPPPRQLREEPPPEPRADRRWEPAQRGFSGSASFRPIN